MPRRSTSPPSAAACGTAPRPAIPPPRRTSSRLPPGRAARRGEHPRHARVPGGPGRGKGRQGRRCLLLAWFTTAVQLTALEPPGRRRRWTPRRCAPGGRKGLGLRSEEDLERPPASRSPTPCPSTSSPGGSPGARRPRRRRRAPSRASSRRTSRWSATAIASRSCSPSTPASGCPSTPDSSACPAPTRPSGDGPGARGEGPAPRAVAPPRPELQIAGRKNWKRRRTSGSDEVLAAEPPGARGPSCRGSVPPQRIAGALHHAVHGRHPAMFVPIVTAIFAREARGRVPTVRGAGTDLGAEPLLRQVGGLEGAAGAARGGRPRTRTSRASAVSDAASPGRGAQGAHLRRRDYPEERTKASAPGVAAAQETGMTVIEVSPLLAGRPGADRFLCLDGIHMTEPYHRLMAKEWRKMLVGAREPYAEAERGCDILTTAGGHGSGEPEGSRSVMSGSGPVPGIPVRRGDEGPGRMEVDVDIAIFDSKQDLGRAAADRARAAIGEAIARGGEARVIAAHRRLAVRCAHGEGRRWAAGRDVPPRRVRRGERHPPRQLRRYLRERIVEAGSTGVASTSWPATRRTRRRSAGASAPSSPAPRSDAAFALLGENGHLAFNDPPADEPGAVPRGRARYACRRQQLGELGLVPRSTTCRAARSRCRIRQILEGARDPLIVLTRARRRRCGPRRRGHARPPVLDPAEPRRDHGLPRP